MVRSSHERSARRGVRPLLSLLLAAPLLLGASEPPATPVGEDTTAMLVDLLKFDTSNPPGNTVAVAEYLKKRFDAAGIPNEIILAPNGRAAHFIARLRGDGSKRPILLAAHTDVVPADPGRWSVDPFGGQIKDGYLYGRGALDNKGAVAAFAAAILRMKREKVPLTRDIIFLAEADEEQGEFNTNWLAKHHWEKIDAEFALNEGGTILRQDGNVTRFFITYADKLTVNIRLRAQGPAGHSSRPMADGASANDQLIAALGRLAAHREPIVLTPPIRAYFQKLARLDPAQNQDAVDRLLAADDDGKRTQAAADVIRLTDDSGGWGTEGLLRNTIVLTMLNAGLKPNIIPGTAEAVVNARLMPGSDLDAFLARLKAVIGNDRISLEVIGARPDEDRAALIRELANTPPSPLTTELYRVLETSARRHWRNVTVLPTLLTASTDATPWRRRGVPVYGIDPFPTNASDKARVHGDDERVRLSDIGEGTAFIFDVLTGVAAKQRSGSSH
jgi:acetylornithine deacetylase/succinyl-diaminopimelate desuccinylase-like protein